MNKEYPYRDQAEKLRRRIERKDFTEGRVVERVQLPPRNSVHKKKKKTNKWKLKYPIIRILVVFFILLPIIILSIYLSNFKDQIGDSKKATGETEEFEIINYDE